MLAQTLLPTRVKSQGLVLKKLKADTAFLEALHTLEYLPNPLPSDSHLLHVTTASFTNQASRQITSYSSILQMELYLQKKNKRKPRTTTLFQPRASLPFKGNKTDAVGEVGSNSTSATVSLSQASSATNEVVTFKRGRLNILETRLKIEIETPTAPSSTGPGLSKAYKASKGCPYCCAEAVTSADCQCDLLEWNIFTTAFL